MKALYEKLDPAELYRSIRRYQKRLEMSYFKKKRILQRIKNESKQRDGRMILFRKLMRHRNPFRLDF